MARTPSITDDEILEAARDVFLEKGFKGTTAEIAERAGISEGTIYRRFSEKFELFRAAMELPYPHWFEKLENRVGEGNLADNLVDIALDMIDFYEEVVPKINMIMSSGDFDPTDDLFHGDEEAPPVESLRRVTEFFERERRLGRLGACDPEIAARSLLGTVFHYAFAEHQGLNDIYPMPRQTFVRGVVRNLLFGIGTDDSTEEVDAQPVSKGDINE